MTSIHPNIAGDACFSLVLFPKETIFNRLLFYFSSKIPKMEKSTIAGEEDIARLVDTFAREHITSKKYLDDCHSALDQKLAGVKMQQLQLKLNEILKDIEQMLDRKMYYIHLLTAEYAECEEQYQRRLQKHCDIIDYFSSKLYLIGYSILRVKHSNESNFCLNCSTRGFLFICRASGKKI